jgi:membrane-bound ClpP family serine protease
MDSLIGVPGEVSAWADEAGTVIVQGSRWNAVADDVLEVGEPVEVIGYTGMTVKVARRVHHETQGV